MKKYDEMVFTIKKYNWHNSIEEARANMWSDISAMLQILFRNDCVAVIREEEEDIIILQYGHDESKEYWGGCYPVWISSDEECTCGCGGEGSCKYNENPDCVQFEEDEVGDCCNCIID